MCHDEYISDSLLGPMRKYFQDNNFGDFMLLVNHGNSQHYEYVRYVQGF